MPSLDNLSTIKNKDICKKRKIGTGTAQDDKKQGKQNNRELKKNVFIWGHYTLSASAAGFNPFQAELNMPSNAEAKKRSVNPNADVVRRVDILVVQNHKH